MAVRDHAHQRACAEAGDAAGQFRVVRHDGADAHHHRVVPAAQRVRLRVEEGAILEWLPQENMLFAGADAT
ncbi:MAG: urease accessory protein UreD, partial [Rhodospirillales bacterium]|nr:urease accessory protein UreD [Rhodospirillales bacterium]